MTFEHKGTLLTDGGGFRIKPAIGLEEIKEIVRDKDTRRTITMNQSLGLDNQHEQSDSVRNNDSGWIDDDVYGPKVR